MQFKYTAKEKNGEEVVGQVEAESANAAADELMGRELYITSLTEVRAHEDIVGAIGKVFSRVTKKDLAIFLRQLSILISAAVPLVQALKILGGQTPNKVLRQTLIDVQREVEGGMKFSLALERYPNVFSSYFINMVRSGETSGRLEEILGYLADQEEKDYELQGKIIGALVYPGFIISVLFGGSFFMLVFVLPKILKMFEEFGATADLPLATRALMFLSKTAQSYWWVVILAVIVGALLFRSYIKTEQGRAWFDFVKLKAPVFGQLFQYLYVIRFARSFNTILVGGITIPQGLRIVRTVIGSPLFEKLIDETIKEVEEGNPMSGVFAKSPHMPAMVTQMLAVGEQTGRLDDVLEKITNFYNREINSVIEIALKLVEPVIMIILGIGVGFLVAGVILPMMNLASVAQ
ncbi:type II secretion system F family protein [Candidatus Uhrbacteria bacterium]|nr:type II secretion system F family protein [Candidatus Uhrbacteria bacterium]